MKKYTSADIADARTTLSQQLNRQLPAVVVEMERLAEHINNLQEKGITRFREIMNLCLYTTIAHADLIVLTEKILVTGDDLAYQRDLFARMLAVTMAEYAEDMTRLLGKQLRDELKLNGLETFVEPFTSMNKRIHDFNAENGGMLRTIRNNAVAHRSLNASIQLKYTFTDTQKVIQLGLQVIAINADLTPLTTEVFKAISENLA